MSKVNPEPPTPDSRLPTPDIVYVVGHQNPDTDSVCSAIAYAALRRATDLPGATPARLGPLWAETAYALDRCGVAAPEVLTDVRQRVADVMNAQPVTVGADATLYEAAGLMRERRIRLVPVLDGRSHLLGVLTVDTLAAHYQEDLALGPTETAPVALDRYLRILGGDLLAGPADRTVAGHVWIAAMPARVVRERVAPGDLVIAGDRERAQVAALEAGAACLVVAGDGPVPERVCALAAARGATLIRSPHDTYASARLLNLSRPVTATMAPPGQTLDPDDLASDAAAALVAPGATALPVVDDDGRVRGVVGRSDLLRGRRKRVILVDHNQRSQAVDGLDEAEILAVLDHHNLGDLRTAEPILFLLEPVGCTATIVAERYRDAGRAPEPPLAGLLLAAIISDTLFLTSPTTTARDRAVVDDLAARAGLDPAAFARELFRARSDFSRTTPRDLVASNLKRYEFGGAALAIGQAETLSTDYFLDHKGDFIAELRRLKDDGHADYALFLATDILHGDSTVLYPGPDERRLVASAFPGCNAGPDAAALPGVVSRKKQVVPPLARALG
ncbi:MAG TPA: putative manganese-dependent inorganic diphosphatase [Thermomicrobiales bacterium]|nr:putative manganese-dependent inorganic diphosphatase [Thermomicrobiales bacterium]